MKKLSEQTKEKISESQKKRYQKHPMTEETKDKISATNLKTWKRIKAETYPE
jgi:hypothetical protein